MRIIFAYKTNETDSQLGYLTTVNQVLWLEEYVNNKLNEGLQTYADFYNLPKQTGEVKSIIIDETPEELNTMSYDLYLDFQKGFMIYNHKVFEIAE